MRNKKYLRQKMLDKVIGVVLYTIPYTDKQSIVHIYTDRYGRVPYLLSLPVSKAARRERAFFFPFSILDLEVEHRSGRDIHRIKEVRQAVVLQHLQFDPVKSSITMFLSEFISKVIREPEPSQSFFEFLTQSIQLFDYIEEGKANFHLCFLVQLSLYLGFYPNTDDYTAVAFFDLINGVFVAQRPSHPHFLPPEEATYFRLLMRMDYTNLHHFRFNRGERMMVLQRIVSYYRLHQTGVGELKSLDVMKALFD